MIRTLNHRTSHTFSFEEKIDALKKIKEHGIEGATSLIAKNQATMTLLKTSLTLLNYTHFLVADGLVERTAMGTFEYVQSHCTKQPTVLSPSFIAECNERRKTELSAAMSYLHAAAIEMKKPQRRSVLNPPIKLTANV